jgi:hypothetical protein
LDDNQANYYASLIGVLQWAVELGRIDIHIHVALLSSYLAQPWLGHLQQALNIFSYLRCHDQSTIVFDHNPVEWDEIQFKKFDWMDFYGTVKEAVPPNAPTP